MYVARYNGSTDEWEVIYTGTREECERYMLHHKRTCRGCKIIDRRTREAPM